MRKYAVSIYLCRLTDTRKLTSSPCMQVANIIPAIEPAIAHMVAEDNMKFAYENEEIGHMREISKNMDVKVGRLHK
jgi:hypothetical protein